MQYFLSHTNIKDRYPSSAILSSTALKSAPDITIYRPSCRQPTISLSLSEFVIQRRLMISCCVWTRLNIEIFRVSEDTHHMRCITNRKAPGTTRSSLPTLQRRRNTTIPGILSSRRRLRHRRCRLPSNQPSDSSSCSLSFAEKFFHFTYDESPDGRVLAAADDADVGVAGRARCSNSDLA